MNTIHKAHDELLRELHEERAFNEKLVKFISHDLANPLAVVKSYMFMLHADRLPPEDREVVWQRMITNNQIAMDMISSVRNVFRIRKETGHLRLDDVTLATVIEDAFKGCQELLNAKALVVDFQSTLESNAVVRAHKESLKNYVLIPLFTHAIQFASSHGQISVNAGMESDQITIKLCISGEDIPRDFKYLLATSFMNNFGGSVTMEADKNKTSVIEIKFPQTHVILTPVPTLNTRPSEEPKFH